MRYLRNRKTAGVAITIGLAVLVVTDVLRKIVEAVGVNVLGLSSPIATSYSLLFSSLVMLPVSLILYKAWFVNSEIVTRKEACNRGVSGVIAGFGVFLLLLASFKFGNKSSWTAFVDRQEGFVRYLSELSAFGLMAFLFAIHVLRPILEELIFRGFMLKAIATKYGFLAGSVGSTVCFVFIHIGVFTPWFVVATVSIVSSYFVLRYKDLVASCSLHITYNSMVTANAILIG